jgi:hypothetical protein
VKSAARASNEVATPERPSWSETTYQNILPGAMRNEGPQMTIAAAALPPAMTAARRQPALRSCQPTMTASGTTPQILIDIPAPRAAPASS